MKRGFGLLWLFLSLAIAAVVGVAAYQAGLSAAVTTAAPGTAVAVPYYYHPEGWGFFGIFPLLFFLFILFLVFRPRRHWYGGGYGHWGRGPWGPWQQGRPGQPTGPQDVPPMFEPMLKSWHARAHGEAPPQNPDSPPAPPA
jgi:hypothetical protein